MIEQVLIFTLGFLVAGLLMMFLLPAYGARGKRLARRQLEMEMPISIAEIAAERDQLRAEFATQQRRIEQRFEAVSAQNIERLSAIATQAGQIDKLTAELAAERAELASARAQLTELELAGKDAPRAAEVDADETAMLRRAISDIGKDVLRMAEALDAPRLVPPVVPNAAAPNNPPAQVQVEAQRAEAQRPEVPLHAAGSV